VRIHLFHKWIEVDRNVIHNRVAPTPIMMQLQSAFNQDCYRTLGLKPGCSQEQIKTAYRHLAKQNHPDVNPDDPNACARMKSINRAYAILSTQDTSKVVFFEGFINQQWYDRVYGCITTITYRCARCDRERVKVVRSRGVV
jgi:DNA replicative helicase MCM subunit Mcm2 (Cdc46/Mcm family)